MPNADWEYLDLPSDPAELTRELALQVFERTDLLFLAYANARASRLATHLQTSSIGAPARGKAAAHD